MRIPDSLFAMHTNSIGQWPQVPFGAFRLWDVGVAWFRLCPNSPTCDFTPLDNAIAKANANGVTDLLYTFGHTPTWASSDPTDTTCFGHGGTSTTNPGGCEAPPDVNADGTGTDAIFKQFVTSVATHAGPRIKYWEMWNEPTASGQWKGTTAQLVRMTKDAAQIIKSLNPNAVILSPCPVGGAAPNWMDGFLSQGGGPSVDIIAYHSYVTQAVAEQVVSQAKNMHAVMAKYGQQNKPLWSTEAGWGRDTDIPDLNLQAAFVARYYVLHWSFGIQRLYWYAWNNPTFGTMWDSTSGLHPAAATYKVVENWLVGAVMPQACSIASNATYTCPLTRSGGYQGLIVFNPSSTLSYTAPSQYMQYRDIKGATHAMPTNGVVTIGPAPLLLEKQQVYDDAARRKSR